MKRIFLFLSSFIIVVAAVGAIYVLATGNADTLRDKLRPGVTAETTPEEAVPVDAAILLEQATDHFLGVNGVEQSDEKGAALVQQAADAGNQRAIGLLGTLYLGGIGIEQNLDEAAKWLALSNDIEGQELAANLLNFQNIVDKLPPEEKEKRLAAAHGAAQTEIRTSFIQALRDLRTQKENAGENVTSNEAVPVEAPTAPDAMDAPQEIAPMADIGEDAIGTEEEEEATGIDGMESMESREAPPSAAE